MVTDHNLIFSDSSLNNEVINESVKHALIKDICRRMTPQPLKIRADMELTCFSSDGIECIKGCHASCGEQFDQRVQSESLINCLAPLCGHNPDTR